MIQKERKKTEMNKFEWGRIHKWEENIEREVTDAVEERVTEHYEVEDIVDLTQEQIDEVTAWRDEHVSEYSPMYIGFTNVFNRWDDENWEPEDE